MREDNSWKNYIQATSQFLTSLMQKRGKLTPVGVGKKWKVTSNRKRPKWERVICLGDRRPYSMDTQHEIHLLLHMYYYLL
jgi:hypothetical protein